MFVAWWVTSGPVHSTSETLNPICCIKVREPKPKPCVNSVAQMVYSLVCWGSLHLVKIRNSHRVCGKQTKQWAETISFVSYAVSSNGYTRRNLIIQSHLIAWKWHYSNPTFFTFNLICCIICPSTIVCHSLLSCTLPEVAGPTPEN